MSTEATSALIERARAKWLAMSSTERAAMIEAQRRSWARAEAGFGSDADEAAYRAAYERGDRDTMRRMDAESQSRIAALAMKEGWGG